MLKKRVITSVVSLAVLAIVLFVIPPAATEVVIGLLILGGAWEWSGFLGVRSSAVRVLYDFMIAVLWAIPYVVTDAAAIVLQVAVAWWLVAFAWALFFPTPIPAAVRWVCGALVLVPLFTALVMLFENGPPYLLFALLIVWAADAGAYFVGKRFGRVKLAPSISPGKS